MKIQGGILSFKKLSHFHLAKPLTSNYEKISSPVFFISKNIKVFFQFKNLSFTSNFQLNWSHLQKRERSSSILSLHTIVLIKYSYFDTLTDGRMDGWMASIQAYSDIKANSV